MFVFDKMGLLTPPGPVAINLDEFKRIFVDEMPSPERSRLFANYRVYVNDLKALVGAGFYQWVDGSFVTKKKHPGDIDVVNFVPYELVQRFKSELEFFKSRHVLAKFGIDAYFVSIFDMGHPFYPRYKGDRAYWWDLFEQVNATRSHKGMKKGFLELNF